MGAPMPGPARGAEPLGKPIAPTSMVNPIAVMRAEVSADSRSVDRLSRYFSSASRIARNAPIAPASVGIAMPVNPFPSPPYIKNKRKAPPVAGLFFYNDRQHIPLCHGIGTGQDRLSGAVALLEANVEEPMRLSEIAGYPGVSGHQLARLFETHLATTPTAFYMGVRLARARQLLLHTTANGNGIAHRSGFPSSVHFSRRYDGTVVTPAYRPMTT